MRAILTLVPLLLPLLAASCGMGSGAPRAAPRHIASAAAAPATAVAAGQTGSGQRSAGGAQRGQARPLVIHRSAAPPRAPAVLVLEFHDVVPAAVRAADPTLAADPYVVSTTQLAADLDFLRSRGFVTLTPRQVAAFVGGRLVVPPRSVLLTFDDGLESFYEYVLPALRARGMRATAFVIAGRVRPDNGPYQPTRLSYMSWPELSRAVATGLVTVGGHTYALHTHRAVRSILPGPAWRIAADLRRANAALAAHLGRAPDTFAYPFGLSSPSYVAALRQTGYRIAFVGGGRPVRRGDDPFHLPRILVTPERDLALLLRYVGSAPAVPAASAPAGVGCAPVPRPSPVGPAVSDKPPVRVEAGPGACRPPAGTGASPRGMSASPASAPRRPTA